MDSPYHDNRLWLPIYSPIRNHRLWLLEHRSAVLIQQQFRVFSARKIGSACCKKGLFSSMDSKKSEADGSPSLLDSEESKADDSSVSSLSASESSREKGYHLQESVPIPSTVAVAAIKSNPMTLSSPRQRHAK
jgi:hypothetical protein